MTREEQIALVNANLAGSPNDWQRKVFSLILRIPSGYLISYGQLARCANREYNLNLVPRNMAWLRGKLYSILGHDTDVPLHRIATQGDAESMKDQPETKTVNRNKRSAEGTYPTPRWYTGSLS